MLRIAAVGLGRLGCFHAESLAYRLPGVCLAAVCSVDESQLNQAKSTFAKIETYTNYEELLRETKVDGVLLSTPSSLHADQISLALQAGLHVFCEKPLDVDLDKCRALIQLKKEYPSQVVMIGFMRRFDPSYQDAKGRIDAGEIGRPILFRSYSVDPVSAIDDALAYAPRSAGQFLDMAVHDFDLARWFLSSEPRQITAAGACYGYPEFAKYNDGDHVGAFLTFKNEAMAFIFAGRGATHGYVVETEIIGTEGSMRIAATPQKNHLEILDTSGVRRECSQGFLERFHEAYINELRHWIACIRREQTPECSLAEGMCASEIAVAAMEAFRSGETQFF